ncbi:uncharacterized protein EDB91DRAFT_1152662, partial [Suillus paluster]|uniref:uncharacterized protein n=1 Tax=Suillus paluster TaxID=48578 RepID=UPI001B86A074
MELVVEQFDSIRRNLGVWKLWSRVTDKDESTFEHLYRGAAHWRYGISFIVRHRLLYPDFRNEAHTRPNVRGFFCLARTVIPWG